LLYKVIFVVTGNLRVISVWNL